MARGCSQNLFCERRCAQKRAQVSVYGEWMQLGGKKKKKKKRDWASEANSASLRTNPLILLSLPIKRKNYLLLHNLHIIPSFLITFLLLLLLVLGKIHSGVSSKLIQQVDIYIFFSRFLIYFCLFVFL